MRFSTGVQAEHVAFAGVSALFLCAACSLSDLETVGGPLRSRAAERLRASVQ